MSPNRTGRHPNRGCPPLGVGGFRFDRSALVTAKKTPTGGLEEHRQARDSAEDGLKQQAPGPGIDICEDHFDSPLRDVLSPRENTQGGDEALCGRENRS